jgi:hypothetical protein
MTGDRHNGPEQQDVESPDDLEAESDPALDAQDEAYVIQLLAELPSAAMPQDVVARIDAALAAERSSAAGDGDPAAPVSSNVTVLPRQRDRRESEHRRRFGLPGLALVAGIAAAGVVAVVIGTAVSNHGDSGTSTAGGAASFASGGAPVESVPGAKAGKRPIVTTSGRDYGPSSVSSSVHADLNSAPTVKDSSGASQKAPQVASPSPAPASSAATATASATATELVQDPQRLVSCLVEVAGGTTRMVLAVDAGTYQGQSAVAIVLPSEDATKVEVYVVAPGCSASDAKVLYFANVPRK